MSEKLYRQFMDEVMLSGDTSRIEEFVAPDYVEHEEFPGIPQGIEGVKAWVEMMNGAFSGLEWDIQDAAEVGDRVWTRTLVRGTHTGDFLGIPATNKPFEIQTIDVVRFRDEKAVEHWGVTDTAALLMQIGVLEPPTLG